MKVLMVRFFILLGIYAYKEPFHIYRLNIKAPEERLGNLKC